MNQSITDFEINDHEYVVDVEGKLAISGKLFSDENNHFLFIDFLPRILENEDRESLLEGTYLGCTVGKKVKLRIQMDESFQNFNPIEHSFSNEGLSLNLKISNPSDLIIEFIYEFSFDNLFIEKENLNNINDILKSFKKIINEPIILKKKN